MIKITSFRAALPMTAIFLLGIVGTNSANANDAMWAKLAEGGKVVLMRHGSWQRGKKGENPLVRDPTCQKEQNLSDEGRRESEMIGERFRARGIPVTEVRYSPYCRTADTAKIAFGTGSEADFLSLLAVLSPDAASAQTAKLNEVIGSYKGKGNLVLVTHEPNINAVSFEMVKPADFVILQPNGGSSFEELGVVRWRESVD